jgi:hypothetical protein
VKELKQLVSDGQKRDVIVADSVALVESEVRSKTGLGGATVKAAFAVVKALKPRILEDSVDSLLDEFVEAIQPFYQKYQEEGCPSTLEKYLVDRAPAVADGLLAITDRRAERARHKTLAKAYTRLRPKGKVHVEQATPGIGRMLDKHITRL